MAYTSKHGITQIKGGRRDNLSISKDQDSPKRPFKPVFLFVPDMEEENHYHIELKRTEARKLHKWLGEYLDDVDGGIIA